MPVEFLSEEQVARFGRFVADPSPLELERFFRLDDEALKLLASKRREENRMGFAVQWGTVRMLGTFLGENPTAVPRGVAVFVGEQLGIQDPESLTAYAERPKTAYEVPVVTARPTRFWRRAGWPPHSRLGPASVAASVSRADQDRGVLECRNAREQKPAVSAIE